MVEKNIGQLSIRDQACHPFFPASLTGNVNTLQTDNLAQSMVKSHLMTTIYQRDCHEGNWPLTPWSTFRPMLSCDRLVAVRCLLLPPSDGMVLRWFQLSNRWQLHTIPFFVYIVKAAESWAGSCRDWEKWFLNQMTSIKKQRKRKRAQRYSEELWPSTHWLPAHCHELSLCVL